MIIILENEDEYMGILIDQVKEVITFSMDMLDYAPKTSDFDVSSKYIHCVGRFKNSLITILNEEKLLKE
jgi:chemotaxis signal transduction protein